MEPEDEAQFYELSQTTQSRRRSNLASVERQRSVFSEGLQTDIFGMLAEMNKKIEQLTEKGADSARHNSDRTHSVA